MRMIYKSYDELDVHTPSRVSTYTFVLVNFVFMDWYKDVPRLYYSMTIYKMIQRELGILQ
jgi:hypothetical protein